MALVEELVEGMRIQRTDCKQVVEVWMAYRKVHKFQRSDEVLVVFVFVFVFVFEYWSSLFSINS